MVFAEPADAYDRAIGRYSQELAPRFLEFAGIQDGPVIDVGCGPGALTALLVEQFGALNVAAVDTSAPFVDACRERLPGVDVRRASGEDLPFAVGSFAAALSQLVLSFVAVPDRMALEMSRVVRRGGRVGACTFEANGFALARTFWDAASRFDPDAPDDARLPMRRMPELVGLFDRTGVRHLRADVIDIEAAYADFPDYWSALSLGVGPTGSYLVRQPEDKRSAIREACFEILGRPTGQFRLPARVLAVCGRV